MFFHTIYYCTPDTMVDICASNQLDAYNTDWVVGRELQALLVDSNKA